MSTAALRQRDIERDVETAEEQHERPSLRALPRWRPRSGPKLVHGIVALAGLAGIVLAQLAMSVALADGAMEVKAIQQETSEAKLQHQTLSEQIATLESPQNLASSAQSLGMVSSEQQFFISMESGAVTSGADAPGQGIEALNAGGMLYVPNELVQSQVPLDNAASQSALQQQREREQQGYPGMLEPAEGVAADD